MSRGVSCVPRGATLVLNIYVWNLRSPESDSSIDDLRHICEPAGLLAEIAGFGEIQGGGTICPGRRVLIVASRILFRVVWESLAHRKIGISPTRQHGFQQTLLSFL